MRRKILPLLVSTAVLAAALTSSKTPSGIDAAYRGDLNEDGRIDIFDLVGLVRLIFTQEFGSERLHRLANVDDSADGKVSLADLMSLVEVFTGRQQRQAVVFSSAVAGVWAVGDGEKVFRDDLDHRCRESNSIWDGEVIRLAGLYNEVLAFQVIVCAGLEGASEVEIAVQPPLHQQTGRTIGAAGASPYGPAGGVELFSEHYLHVQNPTSPLWYYGSPASAPERMTGWIPDALIPPEALSGRGGFPLEVPAGCNQGFWVDLYLPRDTLYEAGVYLGRVSVLEQGWEVASIPLEINLLPHYLPDENHSNVWLYHDSVEPYYPGLSAGQLELMLKHEAHRHRIDLVGGFRAHYTGFDSQVMASYKPYLDGSAFTEAAGYQGPGQGEGEHIFPIGMYGSSVLGDTREQVQAQSDLWVDWFDQNAPGTRYFWYLVDEPGESQFAWIKERAGWIHSNPGPGSRLPVFITRSYTSALAADIDYWAGGQGLDVGLLPALQEKGDDHWFYNGFRPRYGSVILEAEAVDFRLNAWAKYRYQANTWFIWHGTHWRHNSQGPRGHTHQQVFTDPVTFISGPNSWANGDGIVFYPGHSPFYPEDDRGVDRLLPSIRLKNIRRGQQDYEIMWLAEQTAGRDKVLGIVRTVVPRAFDQVSRQEAVPWSQRGDDYDQARARLLELLE